LTSIENFGICCTMHRSSSSHKFEIKTCSQNPFILRLLKFCSQAIRWVQTPDTSCRFHVGSRFRKSPMSYQWPENYTCEFTGQVTDFIRVILLVMCHHWSIHYRSSLVAQGIGKWRCVSKNNGEEKRNKLENTQHTCRTFLIREARCTNTGKVVDFVNACSMVLTRIRSTIIDVCWAQYIIVSKILDGNVQFVRLCHCQHLHIWFLFCSVD